MFVCVCNRVTDTQIRQACAKGAHSLACLQDELKVATCCGRCADCANRVIQAELFERQRGDCVAAPA